MWADSHSRLTQCVKGTVSADYMWWVMRMACWGRLVWGRGWRAGVASSGDEDGVLGSPRLRP